MQEGFFGGALLFMIVAPAFLPNINCLTSFFASQSQIYCGGLPAGIILHLSTDQTYYL